MPQHSSHNKRLWKNQQRILTFSVGCGILLSSDTWESSIYVQRFSLSVFSFQSKILRPLPYTYRNGKSCLSVGSQRHTDSRSNADFLSGNFCCFFIDCFGTARREHFMSWLLYNRGTNAEYRICCHSCAADTRRHNKLMKRSIRVVKVHPCFIRENRGYIDSDTIVWIKYNRYAIIASASGAHGILSVIPKTIRFLPFTSGVVPAKHCRFVHSTDFL